MDTGNTGNNLISPFYSQCNQHDCFWVHNAQPFGAWDVVLTVLAVAVMVATVALFVRLLRAG